jgi:hypothetical protein
MAEQGHAIEPLRASGAQRDLEAGSPDREEHAMLAAMTETAPATIALAFFALYVYARIIARPRR